MKLPTITDLAKSFARTAVPYLVGLVISLALRGGIDLHGYTPQITFAVGTLYYAAARLAERYVSPRFGWLLGVAAAPTYSSGGNGLAQVGHVGVGLISEVVADGRRLGRHVEHDIRSLAFRIANPDVPIKSVQWRRYGQPLDQGQVGSCTGNAMAGLLMTAPFHKTGRTLREKQALELYSRATQLDSIPGAYPPADTGSSGIAVAKAAVELGYITGYSHAFGIKDALAALMAGPAIFGTVWLTGMDTPDYRGIVTATGTERGGHEYEGLGVDAVQKLVWFENSWGPHFGLKGRFALSFTDLDRLLRQQGDVTQPTVPAAA